MLLVLEADKCQLCGPAVFGAQYKNKAVEAMATASAWKEYHF